MSRLIARDVPRECRSQIYSRLTVVRFTLARYLNSAQFVQTAAAAMASMLVPPLGWAHKTEEPDDMAPPPPNAWAWT